MELSLKEIARIVGGKALGSDRVIIRGANSLDEAGPEEISFFADRRYKKNLIKTKASAIIVSEENGLFKGSQVVVSNPVLAYARVAWLFALPVPGFPGISDQAHVHEDCSTGKNVSIYPGVYVGNGAVIGDDVILFPGVFIGEGVKVGAGAVIYPNVTILQGCVIGKNVIIHAGTVIGSDGFGFVRDGPVSVKIPQTGIVQIDDNVEIGANNCIDRAAKGKTWIKRGVKTDNLVQIAHNVVIGEDTVVVSQAGISGSVHIGDQVIIGGQVGISDHVEVGDKAMIGSRSGVAKSISPGEVVSGSPTMPHRRWLKATGLVARLPRIVERLRHLEKRLEEVEKSLTKE
ncbi:MAG: UDP-3-O-(3-hydroxymyristoyl)glucosamine N-acyltransferase [Thermodesulfobacteriota bacterium]|nr:UDP-3-O-(3-hydroxymyristoyl)glucosamine N-acyltransferase [Thermodesulfobacteriota bacterium]